MKRKIYKLLSSAKQGLFALALTAFSGTAYSQATYTLNYTGGVQTLNLSAGTFDIKMWGADGGNSSNTRAGIGGYSNGTLTLLSNTTLYIVVGGTPIYLSAGGLEPGGYNGGGSGYAAATGRAGGGATHIATLTGVLSALVSNTPAVIMVAGGGGGDQNSGSIGHGGGLSGGGTYPGTQTGSSGSAAALFGTFGQGGNITTSYGGGGGGGWYGGGGNQNNSGSGGSGYIGSAGITNGITTMSATTGFVTNPAGASPSNGMVIITELCSITLVASGSNSLNPSICSGQSLTLTTNAISNYSWSTGATSSSLVVSPTTSTVYALTATSPSNCTTSRTISVTVSSGLPVLTVTNTPNNICLGKTATLTASGAVSYTWAGGPGGIINGQTFTPTATSNYTVTGQNGCGTTTSVTTITIAPLAVNASASPSLSCSGNPAVLTVTSAVTGYTWSPGPITGSNVIVVPTVNTVYTVTASDGTCSGVATVTVNTKPNPTLTIVASSQTVCEGAAVTLTAGGAVTYTWISPSSNSPNISDNPTTTTLYQVSGTNSVNCVSSTSQLVFTQPSPTVAITANKNIVCAGDPVTLTASGATTYNWTNGPGTAGNVVNPTSNTTYTVTGTTTPCSGSKTITINVLPASVLASVTTPSICNGASTSLHASGATSYTWVGQIAFSPGNANVSPTVTTIYTVSALTTSVGLSCPSSTNITVTVFNNPVVTIAATKSVVCKTDANVVLTGGGATSYTWSSSSTPSANISVHPQSTTTYSVTGTDANGCMNTASQVISVNACTGIAELKNNDKSISVYPNPSNGEFVVSSDSEITLRVINELGQEIRTIKLSEQNDYKVSVTNLANGVYFIVGQNNTNKVNQKIVVAN